jgi:hypothetical protein
MTKQVLAGSLIFKIDKVGNGQAAYQIRDAADCGNYRQAAGGLTFDKLI